MKKAVKSVVICLLFVALYFGIQFVVSGVVNGVMDYQEIVKMQAEGFDINTEAGAEEYARRATQVLSSTLGMVNFIASVIASGIFVGMAVSSRKRAAKKEGITEDRAQRWSKAGEELGLKKITLRKTLLAVLAGVGMTALINGVLSVIPFPEWLMQSYSTASAPITGMNLIGQLIGIVLAPAVAEELLFRGIVLGKLKKVMPAWAAVLLSALLFGLVHGNLLWICYTFVMGVLVALIDLKYESILPGMIMHFIFNLSGVLIAGLMLPYVVYFGFILIGLGCLAFTLTGKDLKGEGRLAAI